MSFLSLGGPAQSETTAANPPVTTAAAPVSTAFADDDGFIRITPDTTRIVKLEQDAASVIVTNPLHARVLLDTPRTLIVMPRTPGTTPVTVLNARGETILQKTIVVSTTAQSKYVRIRRMCGQTGSGGDCVPTSYFYCPDGCYEVSPVDPTTDSAAVPPPTGGGPSAGGGNNGDNASPPEPQ